MCMNVGVLNRFTIIKILYVVDALTVDVVQLNLSY